MSSHFNDLHIRTPVNRSRKGTKKKSTIPARLLSIKLTLAPVSVFIHVEKKNEKWRNFISISCDCYSFDSILFVFMCLQYNFCFFSLLFLLFQVQKLACHIQTFSIHRLHNNWVVLWRMCEHWTPNTHQITSTHRDRRTRIEPIL